jgi:formylglycine-generating enzyme required for sulfatase activity
LKTVLSSSTPITCDQSTGVFVTARSSVTIPSYSIGKYEVTQELFNAVMGINPSKYQSSTALGSGESSYLLRPVEQVSWYDAITFCNKLSILMGKTPCYSVSGVSSWSSLSYSSIPDENDSNWDNATCNWNANGYRLPTECEWECAARGGTYSTGTPWTYTYSGSTGLTQAWYSSNAGSHTWEVGIKDPNTCGLYDMSGNVFEWCWDNYNTTAISSSTPQTGAASNSSTTQYLRYMRGGGWYSANTYCTVAYRNSSSTLPYQRTRADFGFRLACAGTVPNN